MFILTHLLSIITHYLLIITTLSLSIALILPISSTVDQKSNFIHLIKLPSRHALSNLVRNVPHYCAYELNQLATLDDKLNFKLSLWHCEDITQTIQLLVQKFPDVDVFSSRHTTLRRVKRFAAVGRRGSSVGGLHKDSWIDNVTDPEFSGQWHLINQFKPGSDVEVKEVWDAGILGDNTHVGIIDDGIEWTNPDITDNFCWKCSYDLNGEDGDPMPRLDEEKGNHHGTRCAGLIGAVSNDVCGVGVAPRAKLGGIRVLDGAITDELESKAYHVGFHSNDIYSCSWGPTDNAQTVDGPHDLTKDAIMYAANVGRNGRGALILVASGNGAGAGDSCAFDGYATSVYTFTIGAISSYDKVPSYSEGCSALLGLAYSGGDSSSWPYSPGITTTDWLMGGGDGCTESFSGTSASAPLAAGILSLVLEARPCLIGRDVLWLVALSSRKLDAMAVKEKEEWSLNRAGLYHTNKHGFGILSATRLVKAALAWPGIPWMTIFSTPHLNSTEHLRFSADKTLELKYNVTGEEAGRFYLYTVEQVVLSVNIWSPMRGAISAVLTSPQGSKSLIIPPRQPDRSKELLAHEFNTLHFFGESPVGVWTLSLILENLTGSREETEPDSTDIFSALANAFGLNAGENWVGSEDLMSGKVAVLKQWRLTFHGCPLPNEEVADRVKLVEEAQLLNISQLQQFSTNLTCSRRLVDFGHNEDIIPFYILKTLCLTELFLGIMGVWIIVEDLALPLWGCCPEQNPEELQPLLPHLAQAPEPIEPNSETTSQKCFAGSRKTLANFKSRLKKLCCFSKSTGENQNKQETREDSASDEITSL